MRLMVFATLVLLCLPVICSAQVYSDWTTPTGEWDKGYSLGGTLGMPLVAGIDLAKQFDPRFSGGIGIGFVPDLTALGGQIRFNILSPSADRTVPFVAVGLTQYWLEERKENTDAVAFHTLAGAHHLFGTTFGVSLFLGYTVTLTDSDRPNVDVWGVTDDMSKLFLGIEARYYF
ncbi:MAG: hypothetical protein V2A71_04995 [Candidatus Eisenbacteria bacterium]